MCVKTNSVARMSSPTEILFSDCIEVRVNYGQESWSVPNAAFEIENSLYFLWNINHAFQVILFYFRLQLLLLSIISDSSFFLVHVATHVTSAGKCVNR